MGELMQMVLDIFLVIMQECYIYSLLPMTKRSMTYLPTYVFNVIKLKKKAETDY